MKPCHALNKATKETPIYTYGSSSLIFSLLLIADLYVHAKFLIHRYVDKIILLMSKLNGLNHKLSYREPGEYASMCLCIHL